MVSGFHLAIYNQIMVHHISTAWALRDGAAWALRTDAARALRKALTTFITFAGSKKGRIGTGMKCGRKGI